MNDKKRILTFGIIGLMSAFVIFYFFGMEIVYSDQNLDKDEIIVIAPLLTANAYKMGGYYSYFGSQCDESCLTVDIENDINFGYTSSNNALIHFWQHGIDIVDDYTLYKDPSIIDSYKGVVVLHNEYVPMNVYEALTNHPNVYFMYPNALYAEVEINDGKMTLIRGHNYPTKDIVNGFDWKFENTHPDEYDLECIDFVWKKIDNGYQLNCYPEIALIKDHSIFDIILGDHNANSSS